jgi:hypothetical protein
VIARLEQPRRCREFRPGRLQKRTKNADIVLSFYTNGIEQ